MRRIIKLSNCLIIKLKLLDVQVFREFRFQFGQFGCHRSIVAFVVELQHEAADEVGVHFGLDVEVGIGHAAGDQTGFQIRSSGRR